MTGNCVGIMQGRLLPSVGGQIQAFPGRRWVEEFQLAHALGYTSIEVIADEVDEENPIWNPKTLPQINQAIAETEVTVPFVLADYFMKCPFVGASASELVQRRALLCQLIDVAEAIDAKGVELPFVDASSMRNRQQEDEVCSVLEPCLRYAADRSLVLGFELDLNPASARRFFAALDHPAARANYDTGNSAALGYDVEEEFDAYGHLVANVHVKDRLRGGHTVPLGEGATNLRKVFEVIASSGYEGHYIVQGARGGDDVEAARQYLHFVVEGLQGAVGTG